jgi:molybdate/tungstate transport system ATP-binding protein
MIRVSHLRYSVGAFSLVADLDVRNGEYLVLLGPSGSGKTLLLENICGLLQPSQGKVTLADRDVTSVAPRERGMGYVPQDGALFEHLGVADNLGFALRIRHVPIQERARRVKEVADLLGIAHLLHRRVRGLSGGERQRVALGRALAFRPQVLLLDEPVSALDEPTREAICRQLKQLHRDLGLTVLHVCHSLEEARLVADRIGIMVNGSIAQCGTYMELAENPRTPMVARMLRLANVFSGKGLGDGRIEYGGATLRGPACAGEVRFFVRPWSIRVDAAVAGGPAGELNVVNGTVDTCEHAGPFVAATLSGALPLACYLSHREAAELGIGAGVRVTLSFRPDDVVVLSDD